MRNDAGNQPNKGENITSVQRNIAYSFALHDLSQRRIFGLDNRSLGGDRDLFRGGTHGHIHILTCGQFYLHFNWIMCIAPKALSLYGEGVLSWRKRQN